MAPNVRKNTQSLKVFHQRNIFVLVAQVSTQLGCSVATFSIIIVCIIISGKDTCEGDSGGPLLSYEGINDFADLKFLRGIVSFGSKKCGNVSI